MISIELTEQESALLRSKLIGIAGDLRIRAISRQVMEETMLLEIIIHKIETALLEK